MQTRLRAYEIRGQGGGLRIEPILEHRRRRGKSRRIITPSEACHQEADLGFPLTA